MLIIKKKNKESIDSMLKRLKKKVRNTKQLELLKSKKEYKKKSTKNREMKLRAIYIQKKK